MKADLDLDRVLGAITDPARRRILQALKNAQKAAKTNHLTSAKPNASSACLCAGDIQEQLRLSQPTISHHMAVLTQSGLVEATKQGQWRWYRRNDKSIRKFLKSLRSTL